ncbi:MAG: hypothetical protein EOP93_14610 [Lysobacteraceae bacterium]|nr:MAG: hypothetical protein EOP93_14610 [Xanthomonadaceae bacterium]
MWIDLVHPDEALLRQVWDAVCVPGEALDTLRSGTSPVLQSAGEYFWLRVAAVDEHEGDQVTGAVLALVAGCNRVVSIHEAPLDFIDGLMQQQGNGAEWARLSSESFVAALLDWQLSTYFDAVSDYENAIERLENDILTADGNTSLAELRRLRRWASRLRRMLAPHRVVFGAMSRPDFRASGTELDERHFVAIDTRFERAMDMVENARELVLGSFELFSSKTALQTEERMKVLTFVTVVMGGLATIVGALGMNFQASMFQTGNMGFWVAIGGLCVLTAAGMMFGRRRGWY